MAGNPAWVRGGPSPNPSGRPKIASVVREMARIDTPEAYETVRALMRSGDKDSTRLAAARTVLQLADVLSGSTSSDGESRSLTPNPQPPATPTARLMEIVKAPSSNSGGRAS